MSDMKEMVEAVKAHAKANYNEDGWDIVVECFEDSEIEEEISGATSIEEAIKKMLWLVELKNDRRIDIESEIF